MEATIKPRVKICCISSVEEAQTAIKMGASSLGLVGKMPSGPGPIADELIAHIRSSIPPGVSSFLLTSETSADSIIRHHQKVNTSCIQIVDALSKGSYQQIRQALPSVKLIQVIHVINEQSVEEAINTSKHVDALLLDSGNPNLKVKELGGTGRVHNWNLSKLIREKSTKPVYLAGGINALNVRHAIDFVQPFGIDLCSGVRTMGNLDEKKLTEFFAAIHR